MSFPGSVGKDCFVMLKSIRFGDLVGLFASSRSSDTVYLGWFVRDLVGRLSKMSASRQSVKTHQGSGPIGSSLSSGFQVYLSKCWDPYVSPGWTIQLAFFWVFLPCFCMLIVSLSLLGLDSKSTSLSLGFCVRRPRQYDTICWKFELILGFFLCSWLIVLGGWNQ